MFNQMGKRQLIILSICFVVCGVFIAANGNNKIERPVLKKTILSHKEDVFDESQFVFKPILEEIGSKRQLKILCEITSYMNPEILELNYEKHSMLEVDDDISLPSKWKVLEKSKYKLIGQLIFDIESVEQLSAFGLRIFTYSDHEIIWN